jgi:hypothetical protein
MGLYIRPASLVKEQGTLTNIPPRSTWSFAQGKLQQGEHLVAVANRPHGSVALLVQGQPDFDHVQASGGEFYIVSSTLANKAN